LNNQMESKHPIKINFHPRRDSYITEYSSSKNFGGAANLFGNRFKGPGDKYRSLIQFDFTSLGHNYLPPGSDIVLAVVQLYLFRNEISRLTTLNAYMIKQNWHEFTVNWNNQPLCDTTPSGRVQIEPGYLGTVRLEITDLVRGWYDGSFVNFGLMIKGSEDFDGILGFYSREYADSTLWPKLTVEYHLP
jgi:hypothetical protein